MKKMPELLTLATKGVRHKHFPIGQIILYQDDGVQDVLILKKGAVRIYDIDEQGNEKILHILEPYAVLPLAFFSNDFQPVRWFYAALTDCEVCVLPTSKLTELMKEKGELAFPLVNWYSLEMHELLIRLNGLSKTNTNAKVAVVLKFLANKHSTQRRTGWMRVNFPVNHQLVGDIGGITRESAALIMRQFQRKGIIHNPKQTTLEINPTKLIGLT